VLLTATAGETLVWCRGQVHLLRPGSLLMIEPGDVHRTLNKTSYRAVMVVMQPDLVMELRESANGRCLGAVVTRCPALCDKVLALVETVRACRDLASQEDDAAGLLRLLAPFWTQTAPRREPALVARARRALREAPGASLSLETLASPLRCSPTYLCRVFAEHVGVGPHAYQLQHRLLEARRLLEDGRTVAEAAALTSFGDESHLRRHFRRRFAIAPGRYQRELRRGRPPG
jgi:AraC-like DNA-binding protein